MDSANYQIPEGGIATVRVSMVTSGVPRTRARIYRVPTEDLELRNQWLSLLPIKGKKVCHVNISLAINERSHSTQATKTIHLFLI
jgi:hypothetical protein